MSALQYAKRLFYAFMIAGGMFLILEHITSYGTFEINDIVGHETAGLLIVVVFGFLLLKNTKFKIKSWKENKEEIKYIIQEIKNKFSKKKSILK